MKTCIALAVVLYSQICSAGLASRFELCRPLIDPPARGEAGLLRVPGDVFDQARNFPSDVRILDSQGTQWPFFLVAPTDRLLSEQWTPQILNKAFVDGKEPHWELDLVMSDADAGRVHNRVEIVTTGTDFVRRVEISRPGNNGAAAHVGSGYLIRFPNAHNARNNRIFYPDSDAARLHLKVYTNAKNADESFDIQRVAVCGRNSVAAEREEVPAEQCPVPEKELDEGAQVFILDCGFQNRPVEFVNFEITDPSFVRCVSVFGRNAENDPWRSVGSGGIHRFEEGEETTVQVHAACRWIKVVVRQDDNLPLDIHSISLEAVPRYLAFEAAGELPTRLCFRGWDIAAPKYDLKRRMSDVNALTLPVIDLGVTAPNAPPGPLSVFSKYSGVLSSVVIGAVALMVVWVIIRMMRQQAAERP